MSKGRTLGLVVLLVALAALAGVAVLRMDTSADKGSGLGPAFSYDVSQWARTDTALVGYVESAVIPTPLTEARAIAAGPDGRIYVGGSTSIVVFSESGAAVAAFTVDAPVLCLAIKRRDLMVGTSRGIRVFDPLGTLIGDWELPSERSLPTSIAWHSNLVAVADAGLRAVLVYSPGSLDCRMEGFLVPSPYFDVAVDPSGRLCVVDPGRHRIEIRDWDGREVSAWNRTSLAIDGFSGCCNPSHIAFLPDGGLVTSEKGIPRVKVCGPDGELRSVVAGPESFGDRACAACSGPEQCSTGGNDIAVDRLGRILVLDSRMRAVRVFAAKTPAADGASGGAPR